MAQIPYRANLSAAIFPMTLARAGRSVIVPQADQVFDRRVDPEGEQKNAGIPQIIYGENILPTTEGYQSVALVPETAVPFANFTVDQIFANRGDKIYTATIVSLGATFYSSGPGGYGTWNPITFVGTAVSPARGRVTSAIVRGVCYVLILGSVSNELYTATFSGATLTLTNISASVLPVGFLTTILEICSSYNYLIAIKSDDVVYWSSTTTATDFTPSLVSGAGSGLPNNSLNNLIQVETTNAGFYCVTASGVLIAEYTGNARYPWRFTPINNSSEILGYLTSSQNSESALVLETTGAIRLLSNRGSQLVATEVSEWLRAETPLDIFNYATNTFSVTQVNISSFVPKLKMLYNRYICISCDYRSGLGYTTLVIFDQVLTRYGKLKVIHSHVITADNTNTELNSDKIAVINNLTGAVTTVDFSLYSAVPHAGVMVLGKIQYVRSRFLCLDEVQIECGQLGSLVPAISRNFSAYSITTLDGKTFQPAVPLSPNAAQSTGDVMSYYSSAEGKNVSLLIKGAFDLTSIEMNFHLGGKN